MAHHVVESSVKISADDGLSFRPIASPSDVSSPAPLNLFTWFEVKTRMCLILSLIKGARGQHSGQNYSKHVDFPLFNALTTELTVRAN